jgi:hypothetical protein
VAEARHKNGKERYAADMMAAERMGIMRKSQENDHGLLRFRQIERPSAMGCSVAT